jgi:23S rRNA pseudoU1915 N3-methylase RlmH
LKEERDIGVLLLREACATVHFAEFYTKYLDLDNSVISKVHGMDVIRELLQDSATKIQIRAQNSRIRERMFDHGKDYLCKKMTRDAQSNHHDGTTFELVIGGAYGNAIDMSAISLRGDNRESRWAAKTFSTLEAK